MLISAVEGLLDYYNKLRAEWNWRSEIAVDSGCAAAQLDLRDVHLCARAPRGRHLLCLPLRHGEARVRVFLGQVCVVAEHASAGRLNADHY